MEPVRTPARILIVEDDASHAELILRGFAGSAPSYDLLVSSSLREAQDEIERALPDLVLTDYRLPDGEGMDLVADAAGRFPVVIMTSHGNEDIAVEAMKSGAQDYLVKSADLFDSLPRMAERVLREWNLMAEKGRAEEELKKSELRFRTLFEKAREGILCVSHDGSIVDMNEAFAAMHGYSLDEMKGMSLHDLDPDITSASLQEGTRRVLAGENLVLEVNHHHKDGHLFPLEVSVSTIEISDESFLVAFHRDITERKNLEEQNRRMQQTQRLESLGVLAGGIAHDFNNLLMVIQGNLDMLKCHMTPGSSGWEYMERIEKAAARSTDLCRQMLSYAGKGQMEENSLYIQPLITEMMELLNTSINKKSEIDLRIDEGLPSVRGDAGQIRQVIMNLIINASEAIGDQDGTITISAGEFTVSPADCIVTCLDNRVPPGRYVHLTVQDTGCGMDDETRRRIFEPFFTTKFTGRGLGLSAVLGIIRSHNAFLECSTTPGAGTVFKILFPVQETERQTDMAQMVTLQDWRGSGIVLLVDDEPMVRMVCSDMLTSLGYEVIVAENGHNALELYRMLGSKISLVLLDLTMPKMDGTETFHELKRLDPDVKVILASGYSSDGMVAGMTAAGLSGFIQKPYTLDRLRLVLSEVPAGTGAGTAWPVEGI